MSVQTALHFINHLRQDEMALDHAATLSNLTLDDVLALAEEAGYMFSVEDLRKAFKHDWAMRWIKYGETGMSITE